MTPALAWAFSDSENTEPLISVKRFFSAPLKRAISVRFQPARDCSVDTRQRGNAVRNRVHFQPVTQGVRLDQAVRLAPTCGRSGAAGGAVRGRSSFTPRPAAQRMAGAPSRALCIAFRLTPARGDASKLVASLCGPIGSGVAVASATRLQPFCNSQNIDIVTLSVVVARLHGGASRYACAGAREGARACRVFGKSATLQPVEYIDVEQWVNGCRTVAARLHLQPASPSLGNQGLRGVHSNILVGGYRCAVPDGLASGVRRGRVAESFGDFRPGGAVDLGAMGLPGVWAENGGFLRVCGAGSGRVGMPMLEILAQSIGFAALSDIRHKPVRLQGVALAVPMAGGGDDRAEAPPSPPSRARPIPCTKRHAIFPIWNGISARQSGLIHSGAVRNADGTRQGGGRTDGSGSGWGIRHPAKRALGLGGGLAGMPRRFCDGSVGVSHVN